MEYYGEYLNTFDINKDYVYEMMVTYFDDPLLIKYKVLQNGYTIYATRIHCLLNKEYRYIMVVVKSNDQLKDSEYLRDLRWNSFQTRTLEYIQQLPIHNYTIKRQNIFYVPIYYKDNNKDITNYTCKELPILVSLINNDSSVSNEYQREGTLVAALETYNTIIIFT